MKRVSKCLFGAAVLLLLGEAVCSANWISYIEQKANKERLIVMGEDGTNSVEIFVGDRRTPAVEGPTVSPAGLGETWILFNDHYDLYKIRTDGSGQTRVLCDGGTDSLGAPYYLHLLVGIWSPDGSQILFQPHDDFDTWGRVSLALLPAGHTADETCTSELMRIYEPPSPLTVDAGPGAWNHDGSQIAFSETNMDTEQSRLAVIERQASGVWERIDTIELIPGSPDLPDYQGWDLSWRPQAESGLLIFRVRGEAAFWLASADLRTHVWDYVLDKGSRVQMRFDSYPKWSSNGDEILFTDVEGNLVRWSYPDGDRQVIGSGIRTDWQRDVVAGSCETNADCEDGNTCTADMCSSGECVNFDEPDDTPCGNYAFCRSGGCFTAECGYLDLPICDDEDGCTIDNCVGYRCSFEFDSSIPGCSGGVPGDPCTTGADCLSGLCHPKKKVCK